MNNTQKTIIRCRAIIMHEGKLLVVGHPHDSTFVALPGGRLEWGEDVKTCLRREVIEELGVEPQIGRLQYINNFVDRLDTQSVEFFFEIKNGADFIDCEKLKRTHAEEISRMLWLDQATDMNLLPKTIASDFRQGKLISDEVRFIVE